MNKQTECVWTEKEDYNGDPYYDTSCGTAYCMITGTPEENKYNFCPGKTWKEKNMEIKHNIPVGYLVEIEGGEQNGVRMFVVRQTRDCDGTPLYVLSADIDSVKENERNPYIAKHQGCQEMERRVQEDIAVHERMKKYQEARG